MTLRVLLVCSDSLPHAMGGTECYVAGLAAGLQNGGHHVRIALTSCDHGSYEHDGIPVDSVGGEERAWTEYLQRTAPDVVHFHPVYLTPILPAMAAAKALGLPTVLTYHTATVTCGRATMMLWGKAPCDGLIDVRRCTACVWQQKGLPKLVAQGLARVLVRRAREDRSAAPAARHSLEGERPREPSFGFISRCLPRRLRSMLAIPAQRARHLDEWRQAAALVDRWVATARWVKQVLLTNGIPEDRITVSRQGLPSRGSLETAVSGGTGGESHAPQHKPELGTDQACSSAFTRSGLREATEQDGDRPARAGGTELRTEDSLVRCGPKLGGIRVESPLRIGFLGRIHPLKGLHVLVDAFLAVSKTHPVTLSIAGSPGRGSETYAEELRAKTARSPTCRWLGALSPDQVPAFLRELDVLVVPSVTMETGPITVLDAWQAGIPVLGSDLGGIREWIEEFGGGALFESVNSSALADQVRVLAVDRRQVTKIAVPCRMRTMADVAAEMEKLYTALP